MRTLRSPAARMFLIGTVASAIGVAITLAMDWFPPQASTAAPRIDRLYDVLLIASVPIFVLVMTVAIYSVVRFRARPGDTSDGPPVHGNTRLEVIWVTIPFLIVTALAIYAWIETDRIEASHPNALTVDVNGQQFTWTFRYPQPGGSKPVSSNDLVLPVGRPVEFHIRAADVVHSFWVPAFRLKQDAVPGIKTETRLTPSRLGRYSVVCAELCGIGHATMRQAVRVVTAEDFGRWLDGRAKAAGGAGGGGGAGGVERGANRGAGRDGGEGEGDRAGGGGAARASASAAATGRGGG
ncbi:MAG: cytochrome c oxidase subunit II [Actinomycetota bacterium]|nr:cytochrome c oxidase subunit II [Actinomycetota bacterium]